MYISKSKEQRNRSLFTHAPHEIKLKIETEVKNNIPSPSPSLISYLIPKNFPPTFIFPLGDCKTIWVMLPVPFPTQTAIIVL